MAVQKTGRNAARSPVVRRDSKRRMLKAPETAPTDPAGRAYVRLLGFRATPAPALIEAVRKGVPYSAFERFMAATSMSSSDVATLISIPVRTLSRRKQEGRLTPDESDRLLRASRVVGRAIELFEGDPGEAKQWLARPHRALGGATPGDLVRTEVGALAVDRLIEQLEQGVFV